MTDGKPAGHPTFAHSSQSRHIMRHVSEMYFDI